MVNYYDSIKIDPLEEKISIISNNEYMYFLCKPNVVGVGLGYKIIKNISTVEKCITVFVEKKVPDIMLSSEGRIPKKYRGITTDVVESGIFRELKLVDKIRPVIGGYGISNELSFDETGTFGCLVKDREQNYYMLSNNHVMAERNDAPIGSLIVQPSIEEGGVVKSDAVAILSRFIPLKHSIGFIPRLNQVDCAIAKVINKTLVSSMIAMVGIPQATIVPRIGMQVKKVGATSELTTGIIKNTNVIVLIGSIKGWLLFRNQVIANEICLPGDSGSLLLDNNNNAVGLLMAGAGEGLFAHNPINTVLNSLNVDLVTQEDINNR